MDSVIYYSEKLKSSAYLAVRGDCSSIGCRRSPTVSSSSRGRLRLGGLGPVPVAIAAQAPGFISAGGLAVVVDPHAHDGDVSACRQYRLGLYHLWMCLIGEQLGGCLATVLRAVPQPSATMAPDALAVHARGPPLAAALLAIHWRPARGIPVILRRHHVCAVYLSIIQRVNKDVVKGCVTITI